MLQTTVFQPGPRTYEAQLVPRIFRPWAERLVTTAKLLAGERVLDLACGTGIVARTAASRVGPGGTVKGLDINPMMLEVAREVSTGLATSIEYAEGSAQSLPFDDSSFDAVFCQQGLQFFPDRTAVLREVARVLTPRGRAVFAVWRGPEHHRPMFDLDDQVLNRYLPPEIMEGSDAPFSLGDLGQVRHLFRAAPLSDVYIRCHVGEVRFSSARAMIDGICGAHAPMAEALAGLGDENREALYRDVTAAFESYTDDDGVMFTMTGAVIVARKGTRP